MENVQFGTRDSFGFTRSRQWALHPQMRRHAPATCSKALAPPTCLESLDTHHLKSQLELKEASVRDKNYHFSIANNKNDNFSIGMLVVFRFPKCCALLRLVRNKYDEIGSKCDHARYT